MHERKVSDRNVTIVLGIVCMIFAASLILVMTNYTVIINSKDSQIATLAEQVHQVQEWLEGNLSRLSTLNAQIASLNQEKNQLQIWLDENQTLLNQTQMWLQENMTYYESQISSLNSQITDLQNQIATLQSEINSLNAQITTRSIRVCLSKFKRQSESEMGSNQRGTLHNFARPSSKGHR
jgi:chromosome segregation ATPase